MTSPDVDIKEYEYLVVQHGLEAEKEWSDASKKSSFTEIFRGTNWRRTLAGCVGICSQWSAGAPIVFGYSTVGWDLSIHPLSNFHIELASSTFSKSPVSPTLSSFPS